MPQLLGSAVVSAQKPEQLVRPVGHIDVPAQVPLVQLWPLLQARPHMPQFAGSVAVVTQRPPQRV